MYTRPEKVIAVVSHAGFLRTAIANRRFANADYRVFEISEDSAGHLSLIEDEATEAKGGGMGRCQKGVFRGEQWDFPRENVEV
jgi:hypothetical protein